jgi:hypothetical protein
VEALVKPCDEKLSRKVPWRTMGLEDKAAETERWMRLKGCGEE